MADGGESISALPPAVADDISPVTAPARFSVISRLDLPTSAYWLIILTLLLIDFVPRFYQGDSLTYLMTHWHGWFPPERSWIYGLIVNFLLRYTHGYASYIVLQAVILGIVIGAARRFFREFASWRLAYSLTAIALSLDPLLEFSTRFYMTDFVAAACFMLGLPGLLAVADPAASGTAVRRGLLTNFLAAVAAIFLRIAYLPILELTVIFIGLCGWRRSAEGWARITSAAAIPIVAYGILIGTNSFIFAKLYPHEFFANKMSGLMLASVFAPALAKEDFDKAAIPVTPEEVSRMDLGNYDVRWAQVWSNSPNYLKQFLSDRLNANMLDKSTNDVAQQLVINAFWRNPFSVFDVYLRNALGYLQPVRWHNRAIEEMGLKELPEQFVDYVNQYSTMKLTPAVTRLRSPLLEAFGWFASFYPFLLGLGICSIVVLLLREGPCPYVVVLGSALVSDFLATPLYSIDTIPRFMIAGVFSSYLLVGLAGLSLAGSRQQGREKQVVVA